MSSFLDLLFRQSEFVLAFCALLAACVSYTFASFNSNWMFGLILFPGLYAGAVAAVIVATDAGLITGPEKDDTAIVASFVGVLAALAIYHLLFQMLIRLTSYSRRAHKAIIDRAGSGPQ